MALTLLTVSGLALLMSGCRSASRNNDVVTGRPMSETLLTGTPSMAMPSARIYRTTGDCADLVPITLSSTRTILSYPAPSDINDSQRPLELADGWWLDRRGISDISVFTTYTYKEYAALPTAPTPAELLKHISADCRLTEIADLPMTQAEAVADTAAVNKLIRSGLPGCEVLNLNIK